MSNRSIDRQQIEPKIPKMQSKESRETREADDQQDKEDRDQVKNEGGRQQEDHKVCDTEHKGRDVRTSMRVEQRTSIGPFMYSHFRSEPLLVHCVQPLGLFTRLLPSSIPDSSS